MSWHVHVPGYIWLCVLSRLEVQCYSYFFSYMHVAICTLVALLPGSCVTVVTVTVTCIVDSFSRLALIYFSFAIHNNSREWKTSEKRWSCTSVYECKQKVKTGEPWEQGWSHWMTVFNQSRATTFRWGGKQSDKLPIPFWFQYLEKLVLPQMWSVLATSRELASVEPC